jgi:hypothetical protein
MSKLQEMTEYLEKWPEARERKNKTKVIRNMLKRKYSLDIPDELLMNIIKDSLSIDRYWRRATQLYPELRGSDYGRKAELEGEALIELEYTPDNGIQSKLLTKLIDD